MTGTGQGRAPQEPHGGLGQLQLLFELADAVSRAQEPTEIYRVAAQGLVRAMAVDRAAVLIMDSDDVMRFKAWVGLSDEYRAAVEGHTPWTRGTRDAQPIAVSDVTQDSSLSAFRTVLAKEGVQAVAFVPLLANGGLIGKLMLYYNAPHAFQPEELQLAQTIATHVAFATERQRAEKALRESEVRFRATFFQAAVGIAQAHVDGKWQMANDRFCEILGYARAELMEKTFLGVTHPDDLEAVLKARRRLLAGEISVHSMEKRYVRKDGTTVWARRFLSLVRDQDNRPQHFVSVIEDITDRIKAEHALRDSEQRLRLALSAGVGLWECDLRGKAPVLSPQYSEVFGNPPGTLAEWFRLVHPDDRDRVMALARASIRQVREWSAEFRLLYPDGSIRWLLSKGTVLTGDDGRPARMVGVSLDITERKHAEAALRESEERFRSMADSSPVMICASGPNKLATFFNKGWLDFTGRTIEQELGDGWTEGVHPDDREACLTNYAMSFDARRDCRIEYRLRRADGDYRSVICSGVPRFTSDGVFAGYIASGVDITDMKRAQEEALARQKLESMGLLASGIAHDFNNLLGGILASAEVAMAERADGSFGDEELRRIQTAAVRGAEIVRQLMICSGRESSACQPLDLSVLVEEMLQLLKISISKHATLVSELGEKLPAVHANPLQMRQVVMNLVINASEAIGERPGAIRVTTGLIKIEQESPVTGVPDGDYLQLEVSDTGCGMAPDVQARMFDPFFTTKQAGRGLGLAVVQGIIRAHGGAILLVSAPGQGTKFRILLPATAKKAQAIQSPIAPAAAKPIEQQAKTVLVVEDEYVLRMAVSKALRKRGFSVIEAGDGSAAVDLIRAHPEGIDLLLLDVTIPGIPSRDVLENARRLCPDLKVIITSAYSRETVDASFAGLSVECFIRKPFQLGELVSVLGEAISDS